MPADKGTDEIGSHVAHPGNDQPQKHIEQAIAVAASQTESPQIGQAGKGDGKHHRNEKDKANTLHGQRFMVFNLYNG